MLNALTHRGPDGDGIFQDEAAVLGHRRLSIIDTSTAGRQPMANEDGTLQVSFNGEIYNYRDLRRELVDAGHRFRSHTDTEVLLHGYEQWGISGLLDRLRGMFAFALYDTRRGLLLARDRLGIKPLYYYLQPDVLAFASEVKALLRSGLVNAEIDRSALAGYLMAGAVPAPSTHIKEVKCLPAGHWAEWRDGKFEIRRYWNLEQQTSYDDATPEELHSILEDGVGRHLISDVPLGVFLSSGVDSAGIVALASAIRKKERQALKTLTIVFDEKEYCEADGASDIAKRFETEHQEVRITRDDFQRELPAFLAAMDQPTNDGINSFFVSKAARQAGLTVVLSGVGGDEAFLGYKHYRWMRYSDLAALCPRPVRDLGVALAWRWGRLTGRDNWMRTAWLGQGLSSAAVYLTLRGFFPPHQLARLMDLTQGELNAAMEQHFGNLMEKQPPSAASLNYIELTRYLHDQVLRDTDVFSMAHSVEVRVPYLDHVLIERLWRTNPQTKLAGGMNKALLVNAIGEPIVQAASSRPKKGFTFPMSDWIKAAAPEMQKMAEAGPLVRSAVQQCWGDFSGGRMHWSRAWALTVLGSVAA